jgi:hypothetical protein
VRHFTVLSLQLIRVNGSGTYIFKFAAAFLGVGANIEYIENSAKEASEVFWIAEGARHWHRMQKMKGSHISNLMHGLNVV